MQWTDEGIVLGVRRYGESSVILELMTLERGRHLGLVRGGAGAAAARRAPAGQFAACDLAGAARRPSRQLRGRGHQSARRRLSPGRACRPRRHAPRGACAGCWPNASRMRKSTGRSKPSSMRSAIRSVVAPMIARFELSFLAELGFGLDLSSCAANRLDGRSRLRVAALGPRGVARRQERNTATG